MSYDPATKTVTCDIGGCSTWAPVRDNEPGEDRPVSGRTVPEDNWMIVGTGDILGEPEKANTYCPEHA